MFSSKSKSTDECSFCGKPAAEVRKLVAGEHVRICDSCITVCSDIVHKELAADEARSTIVSIGGGLYNLRYFVALTEQAREQSSVEQWDGKPSQKQLVLHFVGGVSVSVPADERERVEQIIRGLTATNA